MSDTNVTFNPNHCIRISHLHASEVCCMIYPSISLPVHLPSSRNRALELDWTTICVSALWACIALLNWKLQLSFGMHWMICKYKLLKEKSSPFPIIQSAYCSLSDLCSCGHSDTTERGTQSWSSGPWVFSVFRSLWYGGTDCWGLEGCVNLILKSYIFMGEWPTIITISGVHFPTKTDRVP